MRGLVLVLGVAACGGAEGSPSDGAPDGMPDATPDPPDATPDAGQDVIHVHARRAGAPLADIAVLFHDPAGTLLARAVTDAGGDATGDVPDGSMVTVVFPVTIGALTTFDTVVGAVAGDQLVFGTGLPPPALASTASVPPYIGPGTSLDYEVAAPCIVGDAQTTSVGLQATCAPPTHGPAIAVVADTAGAGGFEVLAYQDQADVALPPGASLTFADAWQAAVTQTFAVTNLPPGAMIGLGKTWYRAGQPYFGFARMIPGATTGTIAGPGGGDAWRGQTIVCLDPLIPQCQLRFHDLADPLDLGDDFAAHRTAWLAVPDLTLGARATVDWTADVLLDATVLQTSVFERDAANDGFAQWNVVQTAPVAASGTVTLPELPADLIDLWVGVGISGDAETEIDQTETLTYPEVRVRWFADPLGELDLANRSFSRL